MHVHTCAPPPLQGDESRAVFDGLASKQKEFVVYDTDHRPPPAYAEAVTAWLVRSLGPPDVPR